MAIRRNGNLRIGTPEYKLERLLKFKVEIQELEEDNRKEKENWRALGFRVRERGQKIGKLKQTLMDMI